MGFFDSLLGNNNSKNKFKVGDRVKVKYRGQEGYIIDINGPLYMVSLAGGKHVDSYEEKDLEKCWF